MRDSDCFVLLGRQSLLDLRQINCSAKFGANLVNIRSIGRQTGDLSSSALEYKTVGGVPVGEAVAEVTGVQYEDVFAGLNQVCGYLVGVQHGRSMSTLTVTTRLIPTQSTRARNKKRLCRLGVEHFPAQIQNENQNVHVERGYADTDLVILMLSPKTFVKPPDIWETDGCALAKST